MTAQQPTSTPRKRASRAKSATSKSATPALPEIVTTDADAAKSALVAMSKPVKPVKPVKGLVAEITETVIEPNVVKPVTKRAARSKPVAKSAQPVVVKMSTDNETLPTSVGELRALLKISRDRRWRAGRRNDAELVATMTERIAKIAQAIGALTVKSDKAERVVEPVVEPVAKPVAKRTRKSAAAKSE